MVLGALRAQLATSSKRNQAQTLPLWQLLCPHAHIGRIPLYPPPPLTFRT